MKIRRTAAAAALSLVTAGVVALGAAPAQADTGWDITKSGGTTVADTGWDVTR